MVSNIDVLPTVLELAGLRSPPDIDGRSFLPAVGDPQSLHRAMVYTDIMNKGAMVRSERWKYGFHWEYDDADELYDMDADPHEEHNLARDPACAERVTEMRGHIVKWLRETGHPYAEPISQRMLQK